MCGYFISMATDAVVFWFWKPGGKVSWMSVNAVYLNSVAVSTFCSEIITIPFRFWPHYLLFSQRKWTMSHQDSTTTFMNETGGFRGEVTRTYARKLSHFDRRKSKLSGFLCISLRSCRKGFPNERECRLLTWIPSQCAHFAGESQFIKTA